MNNCLVTKLKGSVDNDNLLKLDEFKMEVIHFDESIPMYLSVEIPIGKKSDLQVRGIGGTVTEVSTAASDSYKIYQVGTGNFEIATNCRTDIIGLRVFSTPAGAMFNGNIVNCIYLSTEEIKYCSSLVTCYCIYLYGSTSNLTIQNWTMIQFSKLTGQASHPEYPYKWLEGNITNIKKDNLTTLQIQDCCDRLTGNISYFADAPILRVLKLTSGSKSDNLSGNIASLASVKTLSGDVDFSRNEVTGNIEDLVAGMFNAGRTSGNFSFNGSGYAFLNGVGAPTYWLRITFSDSGATITNRTTQEVVATYTAATDSWTYA